MGKCGELGSNFIQVETGDFFVQVLGEDFHADGAGVALFPEVDLGKYLIGEAIGHDEAGVPCRATEVDEAAFREEVDAVAGREGEFIYLRLDIQTLDVGVFFQWGDLNFVVKVTDVADDGLILHLFHVLKANNVAIAGGGDVDVRPAEGVFYTEDAVAFHGGLKGANGVDFRDDDLRAHASEGLGAAFAYVAIAADDGDFSRDHDVCRAFDAVEQGFAAAIKVVEFGLGDGVVDVDSGEEELAFLVHLVEAVNTGGGFFRDTFNFL